MKLTIESTATTTEIDGVPVRLWRGRTEDGRPVQVYVHRVGTDDPAASEQLAAALREQPMPKSLDRIMREEATPQAFDLRHIL